MQILLINLYHNKTKNNRGICDNKTKYTVKKPLKWCLKTISNGEINRLYNMFWGIILI